MELKPSPVLQVVLIIIMTVVIIIIILCCLNGIVGIIYCNELLENYAMEKEKLQRTMEFGTITKLDPKPPTKQKSEECTEKELIDSGNHKILQDTKVMGII